MKKLSEQAEDLVKDAEKIIKQILSDDKNVFHEIAALCFKYAILREDLIKEEKLKEKERK